MAQINLELMSNDQLMAPGSIETNRPPSAALPNGPMAVPPVPAIHPWASNRAKIPPPPGSERKKIVQEDFYSD